MYGTERKVGVGFNAPLVLGRRRQHDWRNRYDFMRRLTRFRNDGRLDAPWLPRPASLVEALRQYSK